MMNMEQQDTLLSQIKTLQLQVENLKRERDTYRYRWERSNAMLNSYEGTIWYIDTEYRVWEYNRYFEEEMEYYYGYLPAKGTSIFANYPTENEVVTFWKKHYDIALKGRTHVFSFPVYTPNGKRYHECHLFPAKNKEGEVVGVYAFKEDITERKEAENLVKKTKEKLSVAHQVARLGMWTVYFESGDIHLSKEMQMMLELEPPYPEPLIMPLAKYQQQYVHGKSQSVFSSGVSNLHRNLKNVGYEDKYEYLLHSAKGNERIIFVRRKVIKENVVEGLSQDITEYRTIEREHAQLTADLIQKVKDADQFTYIVSHNLRSPVARILGLASLFQTDENADAAHNLFVIETIQKVASQLDGVIKDLNSILSLKNDHQQDLVSLNLASLLYEVKEFVRSDIEKSQAIVFSDIPVDLEVQAIPSYLHSIFTNFFTNAIKYRHADRIPEISVKILSANRYLKIAVSDNGRGMDMEKVKSRLFSPFSRFDTNTKIEGKGLGLFLVKSQIEAMGGKIEVESKLGEGTTFFVYFPIKV